MAAKASLRRNFEDEGVASGFSPRALSLPSSEGCWPADQLVSTPHKRVHQNFSKGNGSEKFAINIPLSQYSEAQRPHFASQKRPGISGMSRTIGSWRPPSSLATTNSELHPGSSTKDFVLNVSEFAGFKHYPGKSKLGISPSIRYSPTISKNIDGLDSFDEIKDHGLKKSFKRRFITWVAFATAGLILLWPLSYMFDYSFPVWFYLEPVFLSWMEILAVVFLILSFAVAAQVAFPEFFLALQLPSVIKQNVRLYLQLENLRPYLESAWVKSLDAKPNKEALNGPGKGIDRLSENKGNLFHRCLPSISQFLISSYETCYDLLPSRFSSKLSGYAVQKYPNGDCYEGEFYKGKYSGSGVFSYYMKGKYEGDWVDGRYDGFGVETWTKGSRYRGQYKEGVREGYGMYKFYNGDVYTGMWRKGQSHGFGLQVCADGSRYRGEFAWGRRHGYGEYVFRNGDSYAGQYFNDAMHGYGVYQFANGHSYEGSWHEGRKQGLGLYAFKGGDMKAGIWDKGALLTRSTSTALPNCTNAVSHSKALHAVQEARKAARKAENIENVDAKVEKAVNFAYKAAMAARVSAVKALSRGHMEFKPEDEERVDDLDKSTSSLSS